MCAEAAPQTLTMFDEQLGQSEYLAGERFSIADITLGIAIDFARMVKVVEVPDLANISRWYEQISARPSWSAQ